MELLSVSNESMAVSSEYLKYMVLGDGLVQSLVYSVKRKGLRTQPCGAPVLMVMADDIVKKAGHYSSSSSKGY